MNRGELAISSFNRENCKTGIVHLGVGNFHRAHQANYIDEYLNTTNNLNWGICGINLRKEDSKNFENLKLSEIDQIVFSKDIFSSYLETLHELYLRRELFKITQK